MAETTEIRRVALVGGGVIGSGWAARCLAHGLDVVAGQQLDLDGWKMTVDQMASMGAEATEAQLDQIVHYLAKAFPESK
jgi:3-hydroxyacyl-CoA dehydrogenase